MTIFGASRTFAPPEHEKGSNPHKVSLLLAPIIILVRRQSVTISSAKTVTIFGASRTFAPPEHEKGSNPHKVRLLQAPDFYPGAPPVGHHLLSEDDDHFRCIPHLCSSRAREM